MSHHVLKYIILNGSGLNNPEKTEFVNYFTRFFETRGIPSEYIHSKECILDVKGLNDNIILVQKNTPADIQSTYFFVRSRARDEHFISLLTTLFEHFEIPFTDALNSSMPKLGKISQMVQLSLAGIEVPRSIICSSESYRHNKDYILENTSFPCVVKKGGSKGKGVKKVESVEDLESFIHQDQKSLRLIQEFVPNKSDIRIFVFDGEVIASIERTSQDGFYNNVSQGGTARSICITEKEQEVAIAAAHNLGLTLAGIDMVRTDRGPLIFEVNKTPQLEIFNDAAGFDLRECILTKIKDRYSPQSSSL